MQVVARKLVSVNPATGELLRELDSTPEPEVHAAVARARSAQPAWFRLGTLERLAYAKRFQQLLAQRKAALAERLTQEAGKPYAEALSTEVLVVLDSVRFLLTNAYRILRTEPVRHGNLAMKAKLGRVLRQPYGVIGIISPWNYPFSIPATETLAALIAGNTVVLKPSELTPLIALELAELLRAAGFPRDVFELVLGDGRTGKALLDSDIDKLVFTGSVSTGRSVAETAARRFLPVILELGGKDPMIVLKDADIEVASSGAVWGAFVNAGQACLSVERCYVQREIYQPFTEACVRKAEQLHVGNGMDAGTDIGPMIDERQLRIVESQIEEAKASGARVLTGGRRLSELGPNFYSPTVLTDVNHSMRIMREETFGPVLPIMSFDTEAEALRLANDSEYGLGASIWTGNRVRGENLGRCLAAGTVLVNDVVSSYGISEAPHGGVKSSGFGCTHGRFGLEEMVRLQYVAAELLPGIKKPWWYGYGRAFTEQIEALLDMQFAGSLKGRLKGTLQSAGGLIKNRRL